MKKKPAVAMPMNVLEDRSGCTRDTIHFYLRSGLLHAPRKTSATRAEYDATHLDRLLRIRALRDADVSIDRIGEALEALGDAPLSAVHAIGIVLARAAPPPALPRDAGHAVLDPSLLAHHQRLIEQVTPALDAVARQLADAVLAAFDPREPDRAARLLEALRAATAHTLATRVAAHTASAVITRGGRPGRRPARPRA
ncbi:MAG: MerR family transcriptional regulator [Deltaproteobacteria bacterium]